MPISPHSSLPNPEGVQKPVGNVYSSINISGDSRVQLGNSYTQYASTPREQLLKSLYSPLLSQRQNAIKDAADNTFDWIFEVPIPYQAASGSEATPGKEQKAPRFTEWLQHGSSTFWISGKPGSGKSTLMSFIVEDERTRDALELWSEPRDLEILTFYFWRPGADIQKSTSGLLQALLYQLCECFTDDQTSLFTRQFRHGPRRRKSWTERQLKRAILAAFQIAEQTSFCIFIDGLDEYVGDYHELIDLIDELAGMDTVKCCVSSRPEMRLKQRLQLCESLRVHDFNTVDIREYVASKFKSAGINSIPYAHLLNDIVQRAEGVFLWAVLVTQNLVKGVSCGDSHDTLRKRLSNTPGEINELFAQMFNAIDDLHKQSLVFYIQSIMSQYLSGKCSFGSVCDITASILEAPVPHHQFQTECIIVEQQILGQSAGLLEVVETFEVSELGTRAWNHQSDWTKSTIKVDVPLLRSATDVEAGKPQWHNLKRRRLSELTPFPQILRYENILPQWIHRCAHDFLFESEISKDISAAVLTGLKSALLRLCNGRINYVAMAPAFALPGEPDLSTEWRVSHLLRSLTIPYAQRPSQIFPLLDKLHDILEGLDALEVGESPWAELCNPNFDWKCQSIMFWEICTNNGYWEYLQERLKLLALEPAGTILHAYVLEQALRDARSFNRDGESDLRQNKQHFRLLMEVSKILIVWISSALEKATLIATQHPASTKISLMVGVPRDDPQSRRPVQGVSYHTSLHHLARPDMMQMEGLIMESLTRSFFLLRRLTTPQTWATLRDSAESIKRLLQKSLQLFSVQYELNLAQTCRSGTTRRTVLHVTPGFADDESINARDTESFSVRGPGQAMRIITHDSVRGQVVGDPNIVNIRPHLTQEMRYRLAQDDMLVHFKTGEELLGWIVSQDKSCSKEVTEEALTDALAALKLAGPEEKASEGSTAHQAGEQKRKHSFDGETAFKLDKNIVARCHVWPRDPLG